MKKKSFRSSGSGLYSIIVTFLLFTIFAVSAGFQLNKKSILKMQVTKTTLTLRSVWFWLPVFSILIFERGNQPIMQKW